MSRCTRHALYAFLLLAGLLAGLMGCASRTDAPGAQGWCEHDWQKHAARECK